MHHTNMTQILKILLPFTETSELDSAWLMDETSFDLTDNKSRLVERVPKLRNGEISEK